MVLQLPGFSIKISEGTRPRAHSASHLCHSRNQFRNGLFLTPTQTCIEPTNTFSWNTPSFMHPWHLFFPAGAKSLIQQRWNRFSSLWLHYYFAKIQTENKGDNKLYFSSRSNPWKVSVALRTRSDMPADAMVKWWRHLLHAMIIADSPQNQNLQCRIISTKWWDYIIMQTREAISGSRTSMWGSRSLWSLMSGACCGSPVLSCTKKGC